MALFVYAGTLDYPFHFDDRHSIEHNPHIRSLQNLPRFFTDLETFSSERRGTMFRPLLLSTYALNYALHGSDVRGYRWVNLLLHVVCSALVYGLGRVLSGREALGLAAGALFLLHPTHGELITYLSSRSDLMVSCFYLGAVLLAVRARPGGRWGVYAAYVGGLLSKSVAITLPVVIGGHQLWRSGWQRVKRDWVQHAVLVGLSAAFIATIVANGFVSTSISKVPRSLDVQVWTQLKAYVYYLWLFCMPARLSVEPQFFVSPSLWAPAPLLAGLLLASLGFLALRGRGKMAGWGYYWFLITLLPASLVPLNILVSERRMYLASAGLVLIAAWTWGQLAGRSRQNALVIGVLLGLIFANACLARNPVWSSRVALWEDTVDKGPGMFRPRVNLALEYVKQDREEEALRELDAALRIKPDYADAWVELGNIRHARGDLSGAEEAYARALSFSPSLEGAYYNLGNIYHQQGRQAEAIEQYRQALRRHPGFARAHNNLGQACEANGQPEQALTEYRAALDADPGLAQAWYNLAALTEKMGDTGQARAAYFEAYQLLVDDPEFDEDPQYQEFARRAHRAFLRLKE